MEVRGNGRQERMGFRFHRSLRVIPGLGINLSRSGASVSVGPRGAKLNVGPRGRKMTVGLPGTGLSYQTRLSGSARRPSARQVFEAGHGSEDELSGSRAASPVLAAKALCLGAAVALCIHWISSGPTPPPTGKTTSPIAETKDADGIPAAPGETAVTSGPDGAAARTIRDSVVVISTENIRDGASRRAKVVGVAMVSERYSVFGRSGAWVQIGTDVPLGWVGASRLGP